MAETLTEIVQAALRAATGTSNDYYGDWHAYLTAQGIQEGQIDGRILAYGQTVDSTLNCASAAHNYFLLNGITASAYWTLPSRPTPSASVTYVTSDAEFTTALTNLSATGGTIALDPAGSYAARTFTSNPSAMIYITSGTSGGGLVNQTGRASGYARNTRASISSVAFTTAAISNYTFISVNFGTDTSHSGNLVNGTATAPYSSFNAYGCEFSGVPLTSTSYPILVNVASGASFAVGEVITGGTSLSVGTILKIATNQLYVNVTTVGGGGTTAAPFTVAETVAGNIAGSSTVSSLAQMTMYGVNNSFDGFQVHDCLFRYLNNGIKVGVGRAPGGAVSICNNEFNYITEDATAFNYGSGASEFVIAFNEFTLPLGTGSDIGAPHCDSMQFLVGDATAVWTNLKILANIGINGFSRGGFQGMPFASDLTTGFYGAKAAGNIFMYYGSSTTTGFTIDAMQNAYIFANKLGKKSAASSSTTIQRVFSTQGAGNVNRYNTYENGAGGLDTTYNYNLSNSDANYNTVYSGTWPLSAATITDALTEIKASVDYDSGGSLGSYTGYVDWTNKRLNLLLEPSIFNFGSSTGNTVSATNITSSWRKWWGDRTVNVSITGGEYQIANSDGGTPTVTWTSAAGTIAQDQWVQVRGNASASSGTLVNVAFTADGDVSNFPIVTTTADTFDDVDNQVTAWSSNAGGATRTARKGIIAVKYKRDSYTANQVLYGGTNNNGMQCMFVGTNQARFYIGGGSTTRVFNYTSSGAFPTPGGGEYVTLILYFDIQSPSGTDAQLQTINATGGSSARTMTVSNWTSGTSHTLPAGWPAIFDTLTGAGQTLDGGINFFWAHFWDGSTGVDPFIGVDISDANVWTKFYSENIGANGEGPMSVLNGYVSGDKPDYYFTGTAANWNSGIANKGNATVGGTMTVGAGTYA